MQMPVQHPSETAKLRGKADQRAALEDPEGLTADWPAERPKQRKAMRPANSGRRILREKRTIQAMLNIYCRDHHGRDHHGSGGSTSRLCDDCDRLLHYAHQRLDNCVFGELKQPCNQCAVHCYSKSLRPRIQEVMRYAGPRMTLHYPLLSALHLLDKLRGRLK